jgi:hypothetical protein
MLLAYDFPAIKMFAYKMLLEYAVFPKKMAD